MAWVLSPPLPWAPDDIVEDTYTQVLAPVIAEMTARGTPFIGLLSHVLQCLMMEFASLI
jgi:phosphoribosylamine-glycine ligase